VVSHVYVCDGTWAFDHDGWTLEDDLLTDPWPRALAYIARFEPPDAQGRSLHIPDAPLK